ncbi:nickel-dependent lactate racemase [Candidatus Aerophobetes bacterium]|nr:nickel-dependent lactate racemase [Candidatus Aerophobetes bacterium]
MNTRGWKNVDIEYGKSYIRVKVPAHCDVLKMRDVPSLTEPAKEIEHALSHPIGTSPVEKIIFSFKKHPSEMSVTITVSDNTRPVPYSAQSEEGILFPLLKRLKKAGIKDENINIIVGTGTHLPTSDEWKNEALGEVITERYKIEDHSSTSSELIPIGALKGIQVRINRDFMQADIRIATGLVEPHFMAGVSGGRKAVCPGLINLEVTHLFHGVDFMDNPNATNLVLEDNPCHEFSLEVARKVGVDFSVNVTLNGEGKLSGVFAGALEKSHLEAVRKLKEFSLIACQQEYDIVLTQGGKVALNHYQAAKAAYGAIPIIKKGGVVILLAHNSDTEPVGKDEYKEVLKVLKEKGPGRFTEYIKDKSWKFLPDQWQVQKWDQFFRKVGSFENLIYCTTNISSEDLRKFPGKSGYDFVRREKATPEEMVQNAIFYAVQKAQQKLKKEPQMAFIKEGPYAVPVVSPNP